MPSKPKSKLLRRIAIVLILLSGAGLILFVLFYKKTAPNWATLSPQQKIDIWERWLAGNGSIYIRPGTKEFDDMLQEAKALWEAYGLVWDEEAFLAQYESMNQTAGGVYDPKATDKPGAQVVSITNRPGTGP